MIDALISRRGRIRINSSNSDSKSDPGFWTVSPLSWITHGVPGLAVPLIPAMRWGK